LLILRRKKGESIVVAGEIIIKILDIDNNQVKLGIEAPKSISIHRLEIYEKITKENISATNLPSDVEEFISQKLSK